jgi:hypothetical protein
MAGALDLILSHIRARGPLTAAEFMETALYDPDHGYATAPRRSGRGGLFHQRGRRPPLRHDGGSPARRNVDVLRSARARLRRRRAAAGDGQLAEDMLMAAAADFPISSAIFGSPSSSAVLLLGPSAESVQGARRSRQIPDHLPRNVTGVIMPTSCWTLYPSTSS